jgi:hypothetical protein
MSARELDRLEVLSRVAERRLTQRRAAEQLGLSERQVRRLCRALGQRGAAGLVSRKRGRPSNRKLPAAVRDAAVALVRELYADFGPTLAGEKLAAQHGVAVSIGTLRQWMIGAGLWVPRSQRPRRAHQPRHRRSCLGELVQIDGCVSLQREQIGERSMLALYAVAREGRARSHRTSFGWWSTATGSDRPEGGARVPLVLEFYDFYQQQIQACDREIEARVRTLEVGCERPPRCPRPRARGAPPRSPTLRSVRRSSCCAAGST